MTPRTQLVAAWAASTRDEIIGQFDELEIPLVAFMGRDLWDVKA